MMLVSNMWLSGYGHALPCVYSMNNKFWDHNQKWKIEDKVRREEYVNNK